LAVVAFTKIPEAHLKEIVRPIERAMELMRTVLGTEVGMMFARLMVRKYVERMTASELMLPIITRIRKTREIV
jgi:hypothetical protein